MKGRVVGFACFAVVCIVLTVVIGVKIAGVRTGPTYGATADFTDVTGLVAGDPVTVAGVPVGRVSSVRLVAGHARVGMAIDAGVRVPVDTEVSVRWRNLIGQRYLSLVPGRARALLVPGARLSRTTSVVDLSSLVNQLGPLVGEISPQQLNGIFTALAQALDGNEGNTDALVADLNSVLATLARRDATISGLLTDYRTISGSLATRDGQIQTMVDNLVLLSQAFADNTALVDNSLTQLSGLSTGLDRLLTSSGSQLHGVVDNLSVLTGILRSRVGDLEGALHNLPPALQALFSVTDKGHFLDTYVVCASLSPTCQYPIILNAPRATSGSGGGLPLDSAAAYRRLLIGGS